MGRAACSLKGANSRDQWSSLCVASYCSTLLKPPEVALAHSEPPPLFSVVLARGSHPIPSRTRSLSLSAPMVLHDVSCGRVGRRRGPFQNSLSKLLRLFYFLRVRSRAAGLSKLLRLFYCLRVRSRAAGLSICLGCFNVCVCARAQRA